MAGFQAGGVVQRGAINAVISGWLEDTVWHTMLRENACHTVLSWLECLSFTLEDQPLEMSSLIQTVRSRARLDSKHACPSVHVKPVQTGGFRVADLDLTHIGVGGTTLDPVQQLLEGFQ